MKKRLLSMVLALALCVGLATLPAAAAGISRTKSYTAGQFTDVAADAWYATSVKDAFELGLMSGNSASTFNPGGMFTLAEAATIAARMHNLYNGGNGVLPAASGAWYQSAVDYCLQNKIITDGDFDSYTRNATRAEMAQIMAAALPDSAWKAINSVSALPDVSAGTDYSDAIFKLYNAGVFTGNDEYGMFQPYANITRAEVAAIVARCADAGQRKVLALTPLSSRSAPLLTGGYNSSYEMSNGRLLFKDPDTKKYGYLDGSGNVAIAAVYDDAWNFSGGYAKVKQNDKCGVINTSGAVTVPIEYYEVILDKGNGYACEYKNRQSSYGVIAGGRLVTPVQYDESPNSLGDGLYVVAKRVGRNNQLGVVNSAGQEFMPCTYIGEIRYNGLYLFVKDSNTYNIYNTAGQWLANYSGDFKYVKNSGLFAVKEGNKWALATAAGRITEAVYDSVDLKDNCELAVLHYGNQVGLGGLSGEIIAPGVYTDYELSGKYALFAGNGKAGYATSAGVTMSGPSKSTDLYYEYRRYSEGRYYRVANLLFNGSGRLITSQLSSSSSYSDYFSWSEEDSDGNSQRYVFLFKTDEPTLLGPWSDYYSSYPYYRSGDQYGIWDYRFGKLTPANYDSEYEASDAYAEMASRLDKAYNETIYTKGYSIRSNSAGKPCVYLGHDNLGWTPVIEYYKNNMYYDEIREVGEGYYACRFNTTWYLLHA